MTKLLTLTDSHCHLFREYFDNIDSIITNAKNNDVNKIIVNATNLDNFLEAINLSKKYKEVFAAIGFQPEDLNDDTIDILSEIEKHIPEIIAIGEIGLDYYNEFSPRDLQKLIFDKEMELAEKYNKPVIIHSRDAFEDTVSIIKRYPSVKGVIHCFTGSLDEAREYVKLGYKLGIGGIVTFKKSSLLEIVKEIGLENIVLETDSPYLAPTPKRGKVNEPSYLVYTAKFLSDNLNFSLEELARVTESNIKQIFDI